jgi:hypothetical protein
MKKQLIISYIQVYSKPFLVDNAMQKLNKEESLLSLSKEYSFALYLINTLCRAFFSYFSDFMTYDWIKKFLKKLILNLCETIELENDRSYNQ